MVRRPRLARPWIDARMIEHRAAPRLRSLLKGQVIFNNKQSSVDCVVRDISATGARLAISHHHVLPDRFELYVPLKERTYPVQVRWRADEDLGVMFIDGQNVAVRSPADSDLHARVEHLEAEVAALHAIIEKLIGKIQPHS